MHPLLKKEAFKNTYKHKLYPVSRTLNKHKLYPIPNESKWLSFLHDNMPIVVKAHGRPQTKRKRELVREKLSKEVLVLSAQIVMSGDTML